MGKIVELENVYLEYPDNLEEIDENKIDVKNTSKLSLEDLQKKLEETQSLRL